MSKTCDKCGIENKTMTMVTMSSADWQRNEQRHERREKRLSWIIVLLIVLFVGSNFAWLMYENSFEDFVIEQENANGYNNYIGNDGDINNGETNDSDKAEEKEQ